jgi:hypothetical protein
MTWVIIISCLLPTIAVVIGILRANSVGDRIRDFFLERVNREPTIDAAIEEVERQYQAYIKEMDLLQEQNKGLILKVQEELSGNKETPPETRFERILKDDYLL